MVKNSLMVLNLYKDLGTWMFDDAATELKREPFVLGMGEIIDTIVGEDTKSFTAIFSAQPFPGDVHVLVKQRPEFDGTWYKYEATGQMGWLCPALFLYFPEAPEKIYMSASDKRN
jgi:hypothetical protein